MQVFADLGSSNYQFLGSAVAAVGGAWSSVVSISANASINIVTRATNALGTSAYSPALTVVNDSVAPLAPTVALDAASDTGVLGDARTSTAASVVLRGNAEVGSVIAITRSGTTIGTATTDTNGAWQATLSANLTANAANALVVTCLLYTSPSPRDS